MKKGVFVALPFFLLSLVIISSGCGGGAAATSNSHDAVGQNQAPLLPTASLTASPNSITAGTDTSITLTWSAQGATSVAIDNGIGPVSNSPITVKAPTATTTYTLTASNSAGPTTAKATVTVNPAPPASNPPTVANFTASPTTITNGDSVTLNWTTQGATTVTIDDGTNVSTVNASGPISVHPTDTTTYTLKASNSAGTTTANPVTVAVAQSGIQHLIVVMMQNSSFDHLFGTYPGANGLDPTLPSYTQVDQTGATVRPQVLTNYSPPDVNHTRKTYIAAWDNGKMDKYAYTNGDMSMDYYDSSSNVVINGSTYGVGTLWDYANNFALADNFFASAMGSEPANILYMVSASVGTGSDGFGLPEKDNCTAEVLAKSSGGTITPALTYPNVGDQLSAKGLSWAWYQENFANEVSGTCTSYIPQENAFQYFASTANGPNVLNYTTSTFQKLLTDGTLPAVTWVQPAPTHDMHPGSGNIGNSVLWLDNFINSVKNSSAWPNTAIVVLWDESGGWYDHVAPPQISGTLGFGARVPVLVLSPFAKTNYISHQQMDFVSILRFIQANWNLGKFSSADQAAREDQSGDICDLLTVNCIQP